MLQLLALLLPPVSCLLPRLVAPCLTPRFASCHVPLAAYPTVSVPVPSCLVSCLISRLVSRLVSHLASRLISLDQCGPGSHAASYPWIVSSLYLPPRIPPCITSRIPPRIRPCIPALFPAKYLTSFPASHPASYPTSHAALHPCLVSSQASHFVSCLASDCIPPSSPSYSPRWEPARPWQHRRVASRGPQSATDAVVLVDSVPHNSPCFLASCLPKLLSSARMSLAPMRCTSDVQYLTPARLSHGL